MLLLYLPHLVQNEHRSSAKLEVGIFVKTFFYVEPIVSVSLPRLLFQSKQKV